MTWLFLVAGGIFGAIIGSFLNVVIARLPRDESLVTPRSRCPRCEQALPWYDNIPFLSYIWLRGRCRSCHVRISLRYPLVEALTAFLFGAAVNRFGLSVDLAAALVLISSLIAITFIDLDHQIIPNEISLPGIPIGFLFGAFRPTVGPIDAALGVLAGGGILFLIAFLYEKIRGQEGMGMGDVKLLAMLGGFLGWQGVLTALVVGSLIGSLIGLTVMMLKGKSLRLAIPFGPFLALGALVHLFWGTELVAWYLDPLLG